MKHSLLNASPIVVFSVILSNLSVNGLLSAGPCVNLGNQWAVFGPLERRARPVALYPDNHGHSPFNVFDGIEKFGNCVDVRILFQYPVINVTVICRKEDYANQGKQDANVQCPKYEPGVRWSLADLVYVEYDAYRYELRSCAYVNQTHSYRGYMMLADMFEPRLRPRIKELPMWKQRENGSDVLSFRYDGNCEKCNFRNEYVVVAPSLRKKRPDKPMEEAEPFCVDGRMPTFTSDPQPTTDGDSGEYTFSFGSTSVPLALLVVTLILVVMMVISSMCTKKQATRVASSQESQPNRKCSLVVERLSAY